MSPDLVTLEMDPAVIRELGHRIIDLITEEFAGPARRPPFPPAQTTERMESLFGGPVPIDGADPGQILDFLENHLLPAAGNPNHPRQMAYVLTASTPLPAMLEALVAAIKLRPTTWKNQPGSCRIETTVTRWLGSMTGFSDEAAGYVTSGGSTANLFALAVARVRRAGWDVRKEGLYGHPRLTVYASSQTHSCFTRSVEMLGLGSESLRLIPVDSHQRIRLDLLVRAIRHDIDDGCRPFCVVGNAGTVDTGSIDPLDALADIARRHDLWFHVDGAYGALAAIVPEARHLFRGIERADSLTVDPHKWLNVPFEAGCILVGDRADLSDTFGLVPAYLRGAMGAEQNQYECGFELSRTDRALKVWVALRQYGLGHYTAMIRGHLELARHLARLVEEAPDFELMGEPVLSICCFRYAPPGVDVDLNRLNEDLEMRLMEDGRALISGTVLEGRQVLRACIASHMVTKAGVEETLGLLRQLGQSLLAAAASA